MVYNSIQSPTGAEITMRTLGSVEAILSDTHVLIRSDLDLAADKILTVFLQLTFPANKSPAGLSVIYVPKGEIQVLLKQKDDIYLAQRFQTRVYRKKVSGAFDALESPLAAFLGPREVDAVEWSAELDESQNLDLPIDRLIRIGDIVGEREDA